MFKLTCVKCYVIVNTLGLILQGLPSVLAPVADQLPAGYAVYLAVATGVMNLAVAAYHMATEKAAALPAAA